MNLDLAEFKSRVEKASDIYIDEMTQQAGVIAAAVNDPSKIDQMIPKKQGHKEESAKNVKNDIDKFKRDFGGGF